MNVVYFYTSNGAASENMIPKWDANIESNNHFARQIWTEGPFQMLDLLVQKGYFDHQFVFIDSMRNPGKFKATRHSTIYVVPHLSESLKYIRPGDLIYARGGFKPWYGTLQTLAKNKHWIMFYRANTNRSPWPFWDIVLDDLVDKNYNYRGRLGYAFSKPINEKLFYPFPVKKKFDVMVGASHVHVKKGQHRTFQILKKYKEIYGKSLSICFPGSYIKSWTNKIILDILETKKLNVYVPGFVSRKSLCSLMNHTKLFLHFGVGGQNDRGVLEALSVGIPVMITSPSRFSPFISQNKKLGKTIPPNLSDEQIAIEIHKMIEQIDNGEYKNVWEEYLKENGMEEKAIPRMVRLIDFIKENPIPNRQKLLEEFL